MGDAMQVVGNGQEGHSLRHTPDHPRWGWTLEGTKWRKCMGIEPTAKTRGKRRILTKAAQIAAQLAHGRPLWTPVWRP